MGHFRRFADRDSVEQSLQKFSESADLLYGEPCEKVTLDLDDLRGQLRKQLDTVAGEGDRVATTILRVRVSLYQLLGLEFVQQSDHGRAVNSMELTQSPLTQGFSTREVTHEPEVARADAVRLQHGRRALSNLLRRPVQEKAKRSFGALVHISSA